MKQFCAEIYVSGNDDAKPDSLKLAVEEYLLLRARRFSPDRNFNWSSAKCEVIVFDAVKTPI